MNINWKTLWKNPPSENCHICIKIGDNYETYRFVRYSTIGWGLYKHPLKEIDITAIPPHALYIILDEIL